MPRTSLINEKDCVIREVFDDGYFLISWLDSKDLLEPINVKWLKLYYL